MKFLLGFEDVAYYLQYNARNEFFDKGLFKPNDECMEKSCVENQKYIKENKIDTLKDREAMINKKREESRVEQEDGLTEDELSKWGIEMIDDSEAGQKEVVIDEKERDATDLADLMKKMQAGD